MSISCGAGGGPVGGATGIRARRRRRGVRSACALVLALLTQGPWLSPVRAQDAPDAPQPPQTFEVKADRDSLLTEIQAYTRMIRSLRDSLSRDESGLRLSPAQREKLEGNIAEITQVVERISKEMSRMEFEIKDNRISLVNEAGEGIVINVPEDLDAQVSQGIKAITQVILSELPDSVDFDHSKKWDWSRFRPEPPPPPRRIINGNIVKIWQDVHISAKEDVRGNVVVIFGDAEVSGRVDGSVVAVFGDLRLDASSEVTGSVVAVGGYLDQDPAAEVDDVVAIDPLQRGRGEGWIGLFRHDALSFAISQGTFLLTLMLAILAVVVTPRLRFEHITGALRGGPMASLGLGVLAALGGHALVAVLMAVLVLTVIGIPLALLVGLVLLVVVVLAVAVCGAVLGDRICRLLGGRCHAPWLVVLVGMTALHVVSFLGALLGLLGSAPALASIVVALGMAIKILAYLLGLGALVLSRFGSRAPTT